MENKHMRMMAYEALRNAIVIQAAADYRKAVRKIKKAEQKLIPLEERLAELRLLPAEDENGTEDLALKSRINDVKQKINTQNKAVNSGRRDIVQIEKFFRSSWYKTICSVNGEMILEELRKEAEDEC